MPRAPKGKNSKTVVPAGPAIPGSPLYRILEAVARRIAIKLRRDDGPAPQKGKGPSAKQYVVRSGVAAECHPAAERPPLVE
jgi:hypothetical protein